MTNEHPAGADPRELNDATIVVNAVSGHDSGVDPEAVGDETVVVTSDETVAATSDQTVVASGHVTDSADAPTNDHTVVVTRDEANEAGDETIVVTSDATVVVPGAVPERRRDRRSAGRRNAQEAASSNPAPPIEDTHYNRDFHYGVGTGLDSERPIAPVPGSMPWDVQPVGERGLSQGLPVSYGARMQTATPLQTGIDEAQRQVGPVPAATPVSVVEGRPQLPSLQRKDRRRRVITIAVYGGVIAASVLGLWGVAVIAFG